MVLGLPHLLLCLAGFVGCSALDPELDSCETLGSEPCEPDLGTGGSGILEPDAMAPLPDNWKCLREPAAFTPPEQLPFVAYVVAVVDFATPNPMAPPTDLDLKVCAVGDADCANPIPAQIGPVAGQPPALYQIGMPFGFLGFLKMTAPGYLQQDYYFSGPMVGNLTGGQIVQSDFLTLVRATSLETFFDDFSLQRTEGTGIVGLTLADCDGQRAAGATLELIEGQDGLDGTFGWTVSDGIPTRWSDQPIRTDSRAVVGFANIPAPGTIRVQGSITLGGEKFVFGERVFRVRPDQITGGRVWPGGSIGL